MSLSIYQNHDLEKQIGGEADYKRTVRANARALWAGETDFFGFTDMMVGTIKRGLTYAWYDGAKVCGINSIELNSEEYAAIQMAINTEIGRLIGFGQYIEKFSKKNGGKVSTILARANMWGGSYAMVKSQAMTMACADKKLKWVWNPIKEHCDDCRRLNGKVYRASVWRKYDIYPRAWKLRCRGRYCGCNFIPTDDPVTSGRPPRI